MSVVGFTLRASYVTEQKQQFQGVDPAVHPKPQSCRRAPEAYSRPDVAMETTTSHKVGCTAPDFASSVEERRKLFFGDEIL